MSLLYLPEELLETILACLPLKTFLACESTCRQLAKLCNNSLIWRYHCMDQYHYWHPTHRVEELLKAPAVNTNWRHLLLTRVHTDLAISISFHDILATQSQRLKNAELITKHGYDAKDVLLRHAECPDDAMDVLARRYHSLEVLGSIERGVALEEWTKLRVEPNTVPLERALGAFDLFIAERPPETLDQIQMHLDRLANDFKAAHQLAEYTPRRTAIALADFMRAHNLTGLTSPDTYYQLQNSLISIALCEHDHPSLPLISAAIYSGVAQRLGLNVHLCGFPGHIYARLIPQQGKDMDDQNSTEGAPMYLDPFNGSREVPVTHLRSLLSSYGIANDLHASYLGSSSTADMIQRTAANLMRAFDESQDYTTVLQTPASTIIAAPVPVRTIIDPIRAVFAVLWISLILAPPNHSSGGIHQYHHLHGHLNDLVHRLISDFRTDIPLLEQHIIPMFENGSEERAHLERFVAAIRSEDGAAIVPKHRLNHGSGAGKVKYKVGTLFRHARYGYRAVITGWDGKCEMGDDWIAQMRVDSLPGGRQQSFYNALVEDRSMRYVAEENVHPLNRQDGRFGAVEEPSESFLRIAGKYFKRWDRENGVFVSNIKDQYPDD